LSVTSTASASRGERAAAIASAAVACSGKWRPPGVLALTRD
jgi:hypothetical protein